MRNVQITEENILKYLAREWWPKTFDEMMRDWSIPKEVSAQKEISTFLYALHNLILKEEVVLLWNPKREAHVCTTPSNPNQRGLDPAAVPKYNQP